MDWSRLIDGPAQCRVVCVIAACIRHAFPHFLRTDLSYPPPRVLQTIEYHYGKHHAACECCVSFFTLLALGLAILVRFNARVSTGYMARPARRQHTVVRSATLNSTHPFFFCAAVFLSCFLRKCIRSGGMESAVPPSARLERRGVALASTIDRSIRRILLLLLLAVLRVCETCATTRLR